MSYRRTHESPGLEIEGSTAGATGSRDLGLPDALAALFTRWMVTEGLLSRVTEEQCADLAKAYMAGFLMGAIH